MSSKKKTVEANKNDQILESSKGKFESLIVIGQTNDGKIWVDASEMNYPYIHWMLNKTIFEMNVHEKTDKVKEVAEAVTGAK